MAYLLVLTINLPGTFLLGRKPEPRAGQGYILGFTFKSVCSPGREKTQINTRLIFEDSLRFQALTSALLNPTRRAGEPTRGRISHDSRVVRGVSPEQWEDPRLPEPARLDFCQNPGHRGVATPWGQAPEVLAVTGADFQVTLGAGRGDSCSEVLRGRSKALRFHAASLLGSVFVSGISGVSGTHVHDAAFLGHGLPRVCR